MPQLIPSIVVHHLDDNHRSTPQVVGAAVAALGSAATGTPRSTRPDGPVPVIRAFLDETAEAQGVVDALLAWTASGRSLSDQAVLARTNDQLAVVATALRRAGHPLSPRARTRGGLDHRVERGAAPAEGAPMSMRRWSW